jgi:hypothetical protein
MIAFRRHLRLFATAWLVFQAASFSTLVPRDCCAAHRPAQADAACHEAAPPQTVAGAGAHAHHQGTPIDDGDDCTMRGGCDGPMAGFLAQLSLHGVLNDPLQVTPVLAVAGVAVRAHEDLIGRLVPPDSPPPRA